MQLFGFIRPMLVKDKKFLSKKNIRWRFWDDKSKMSGNVNDELKKNINICLYKRYNTKIGKCVQEFK